MNPLRHLCLALALGASPLTAQVTASLTHYGAPCPDGDNVLQTQGLPQFGTTLRVDWPAGCCGMCFCHPFLVVGTQRTSTPILLPNTFTGVMHECVLLTSPALILPGAVHSISIPNQPALAGVQFHLQMLYYEGFLPSYLETASTDAVECTIGI